MAKVVVTAIAAADLESLIISHSLPIDTKERLKRAIASLQRFPELGSVLERSWQGYRFVLGPWRWMLIVYEYQMPSDIEASDTVAIVTIQDSRSRTSPTSES